MTQAELIQALTTRGYAEVTARGLTHWRAKKLLPPYQTRKGKGRGTHQFWVQSDILDQAIAVCEFMRQHRRIATRSLKLTERLAFCDPVEAGQYLFETRKMFGAPYKISYSDAFHSLNGKIGSRAIVGSGSKITWTVAPTHEQLPIEKCFLLANCLMYSRPAPFVRRNS